MTDNNAECELTQRKGKESIAEEDKIETETNQPKVKETNETKVEERSTWETTKYYFNRFRYYHFVVADTIDKYVSAACLWFINLYFKLFMGIGPEPASILTEDE